MEEIIQHIQTLNTFFTTSIELLAVFLHIALVMLVLIGVVYAFKRGEKYWLLSFSIVFLSYLISVLPSGVPIN